MNKVTSVIVYIVIFAVAYSGVSYGIRALSGNTKDPASLTKEEYLANVNKNCTKDNMFTAAECQCVYTEMIDTYGVEATLKFDKAAAAGEEQDYDQYQDIFKKCLDY